MYAACSEPENRDVTRAGFAGLFRYVEQVTGGSVSEIRDLFAMRIFMNVAAAMGLPGLAATTTRCPGAPLHALRPAKVGEIRPELAAEAA